jgi:ATP synthase F1 epsilon subunit
MQVAVIAQDGVVLAEQEVRILTLPTPSGRIQVLSGHENLVTQLEVGEIVVEPAAAGAKSIKIAAAGGVALINPQSVKVLVAYADLAENLVAEEISAAIKNAEEKIASASLPSAELIQLEKYLRYQRFAFTRTTAL